MTNKPKATAKRRKPRKKALGMVADAIRDPVQITVTAEQARWIAKFAYTQSLTSYGEDWDDTKEWAKIGKAAERAILAAGHPLHVTHHR